MPVVSKDTIFKNVLKIEGWNYRDISCERLTPPKNQGPRKTVTGRGFSPVVNELYPFGHAVKF